MSDPNPQVSLEEVRVRFLAAEARLSDAVSAVGLIQQAAERLTDARKGLGAAGNRLSELAAATGEVASSLADNATHLREGVDAIMAGDPAKTRRQIEELDAAFTAMQYVVGERLTKLEQGGASISRSIDVLSDALVADAAKARRERVIATVVLGVLSLTTLVLLLVRHQ